MKVKKRITLVIPVGPARSFEVEESLQKLHKRIEIFVELGENPSLNRNKGIKSAHTEFVAFANSHCTIPAEWVDAVERFFDAHPEIDIVGGPQLTHRRESSFARASGYALSSLFGGADLRSRYSRMPSILKANEKHLTSANLICRKKVFKKVMFDEKLWPGEDPKFISDAITAGFKVAYESSIYVYHKRRESFKDLSYQMFSYGAVRNKKEPLKSTIIKPMFLIPSTFVLYLLFLPLLSILNIYFVLPLMVYVALNLLFSFYESIRNKDIGTLHLLPAVLFTIHISYGVGFIYGKISRV
ncbi:glycosyltransferase [Candidatus Pacearchaeota archaeon]|nr:glycosyltransferase [Candidatus Pacearchaeota archaeon]